MSSQELQPHSTYDPRTVGSAIWARKWSALAVVVIIVVGGMALSFRQTPIYESSTEILVQEPVLAVGTGGSISYGTVALEDEAKIATSEPIAKQVATEMGFDGPLEQLANMVRVSPSQGTSLVLEFVAQSPDPKRAAEVANTFAAVYLAERNADILDGLTDKLRSAEERLAAVTKKLKRTPPERAAEYASLVGQQAALTATRNDHAAAVPQVKEEQGVVLQEATPGTTPVKPNHARDLAIALIAGIVIAAGLAMFLESLDNKMRGADDIEAQSGGALLGAIPHFPASRKGTGKRLVVLDEPRSPAAEAYRTLKTGLMFSASGKGLRSIEVTSSEKSEGKSTTSANLALVMAQAEERVLLIDGDLRRPSVHTVLGLSNKTGLSEVLAGQSDPITAIQKSQLPRLRVLTSGALPPNPVELLGSSAMEMMLAQARELFDWIIIDAPPALGVADASVLAHKVDGVLFVVSEGTGREVVAHARDQLAKVNATIIGTVLNNLTKASRTYFPGYGYNRYYAGYEPRKGDATMPADEAEAAMQGSLDALDEAFPADPSSK